MGTLSETDEKAIKGKKAVMNDVKGGKAASTQANTQKPDQQYPNMPGIKYVQ